MLFSVPPCLRGEHRTQSNLFRSTPAEKADLGSKLSLASTSAHTSPCAVIFAITARSTLVRPDDAGPQISVNPPRGSPPVSASKASIPLRTIAAAGLSASRDAATTDGISMPLSRRAPPRET